MGNLGNDPLDSSVDQEVHFGDEPLRNVKEQNDENHGIQSVIENENEPDSSVKKHIHFKAAKSEQESSNLLFEDIPDDIRFSESMAIDTEYDAHVQSNTVELLSDELSEAVTVMTKLMHWFTMPLDVLFKYTCPPAGEGTVKCPHFRDLLECS